MGIKKTAGFTIVEVSLVLTIGALLMSGLFVGITAAIRTQRFTESVDGTQSFLQLQYNETQNVVNSRTAACVSGDSTVAGTSQKCLLLGRLINFNGPNVTVSDIVVNDVPGLDIPPYASLTVLELLNKPGLLTPRVRDTNVSTFTVPWQGTMDTPTMNGASVRNIALIRSPRSGELGVYTSSAGAGNIVVSEFPTSNARVRTCIRSTESNARAELSITSVSSQDGVTTRYEGSPC